MYNFSDYHLSAFKFRNIFSSLNTTHMASNVEEDYDSDTELVPDYDMVDLNDFKLVKGDELAGGSWESVIEHLRDESRSLQFALPAFKVGDNLDIETASKNGFFRVTLLDNEPKHVQFKKFIDTLETWLVSQIVNNHDQWFGHMWNENGALSGKPKPSPNKIKEMYHPIIDDDNVFCSRVHIRTRGNKSSYEVQCMDSEQNLIPLDSIKNCNVVPLVEVKGVFMKPRGYNPDIVLRGLVTIPEEKKNDTSDTDFCLFYTDDKEEQFQYTDYATEDEDTDYESDVESGDPKQTKEIVIPSEVTGEVPGQVSAEAPATVSAEVSTEVPKEVSPQEITPQPTLEQTKSVLKKPETENNKEKISTTNLDNETLQALMKAKEEAILAAKNAEDLYQKYSSQASS
tara:strand:- start:4759 stop:5955 length:1197 start_codon:yes stop_codon:yes gene_type:complete